MGPKATTALGIVTGLITFLAMAVLGVMAANGVHEADAAPVQASAAAGATASGNPDLNGDGFLSLAEAAGDEHVVTRFNRADRNRDGKLSRTEFARLDNLPQPKAKKSKPRTVRESVRRHAAAASAAGAH